MPSDNDSSDTSSESSDTSSEEESSEEEVFSKLSYQITNKLSLSDKKSEGIYFTPRDIIETSLQRITKYTDEHKLQVKTILEPSCGSCEFVSYIQKVFPEAQMDAVEKNAYIYSKIKHLATKTLHIYNDDYLSYKGSSYDLIIGNPPYYVMKKNTVDSIYHEYFDGRPNIFILFIIRSLVMLKVDGILCFVLPKSFLNCVYYNKIRCEINQHCKIIDIINCGESSYIDTAQDTIVLIIQKKHEMSLLDEDNSDDSSDDSSDEEIPPKNKSIDNTTYCLKVHEYTIFNTSVDMVKLLELYKDSTSLDKLGFKVSVGTVVWNQVKNILTRDEKRTRLIYSSDVMNNKLTLSKFKNKEKKHYIKKEGKKGPILVVNRGYGKGEYTFAYCLINIKEQYLIENHLICITPKKVQTTDNLLKQYESIIKSLSDERTKKFVKLYFGNNAINTTELQYILPIYTK